MEVDCREERNDDISHGDNTNTNTNDSNVSSAIVENNGGTKEGDELKTTTTPTTTSSSTRTTITTTSDDNNQQSTTTNIIGTDNDNNTNTNSKNETTDTTTSTIINSSSNNTTNILDPLIYHSIQHDTVQEGDCIILQFGDGRMIFAYCNYTSNSMNYRGKRVETTVKINRRSYPTAPIIGLPYGSVLEQGLSKLIPLPDGSDLIPEIPPDLLLVDTNNENDVDDNDNNDQQQDGDNDDEDNEQDVNESGFVDETNTTINDDDKNQKSTNTTLSSSKKRKAADETNIIVTSLKRDNRNIVDNNTAQTLEQSELMQLRMSGVEGSTIVAKVIKNSTTFEQKTIYSRAKYVAKKQRKYQPRCRIVRPNSDSVCRLLYNKEPKKILYIRNDTLGQILAYANITAGHQVLVYEHCQGLLTASIAARLGGYGAVLSLFTGQQNSFDDMISKFNFSFYEQYCIKWIHCSHVFQNRDINRNTDLMDTTVLPDIPIDPDDIALDEAERTDRNIVEWPFPLQNHTREYLTNDPLMQQSSNVHDFLLRRATRFIRKVTRQTPMEIRTEYLLARPCDSLIIAITKYEPLIILQHLFPYLAPSCPFVIYSEFIKPLCECFRYLQWIEPNKDNGDETKEQLPLGINLRLTDTWMREYQILPGRTHPVMTMSQSGGFLLTGIKLDPIHGHNELDPTELSAIKAKLGGRRQRHGQRKNRNTNNNSNKNTNTNNTVDG